VFGDLDTSDHQATAAGPTARADALERPRPNGIASICVRDEMRKGRQAFIVCPLVDESETLDLTAAHELYEDFPYRQFKDFPRWPLAWPTVDDESAA